MNQGLTKEDISWVVIVDGEHRYEADSKAEAEEWATEHGIEPDRIASKGPLNTPLYL